MDKEELRRKIENLQCELIKFKNELTEIKVNADADMWDEAKDYIKQVNDTMYELESLVLYVIEFDNTFSK